jgi:hypothetical protein
MNVRLLRDRLKPGEIPELPLVHRDLGHRVFEHPIAKHGQPALLGIGEHQRRK